MGQKLRHDDAMEAVAAAVIQAADSDPDMIYNRDSIEERKFSRRRQPGRERDG
jgi:hypothetical protein